MIDHVILTVSDYASSRAFYLAALEPLGYEIVMEFGQGAGYGVAGKPDFWIHQGDPQRPPVHVAFSSGDRETVDRFWKAAVAAGGRDNGPPGLRTHYHPSYYGAFVLDPDGNNIEAVCHRPSPEGA
ncbi:MAG TPA: VOC family protein [Thermoanaerobaculales bacterium]|nr:VOC family protein [Thermoanaerobaculales bacterium]HPA81107.1 VOC family protein [Thermoanaerobaculales bacterium]HQL28891.1 VOC family protein [Thermoanaerobaculales bacterium]HQN96382.1 VOC family protein [Thermoanaerobaculales bacterium]HQP44248.1 VOC family protein [Thermoanaerobaculales bacterium]